MNVFTEQDQFILDALNTELGAMRSHCISENRDPNSAERKKATGILQQIKELESKPTTSSVVRRFQPGDTGGGGFHEGRSYFSDNGGFETAGHFFQAVMRAGSPGMQADPRLFQTRDVTGLSKGTPSDGGFLVADSFSSEVMQTIWNENEVISRCKHFQIGGNSNSVKIPGIDETSRVDGSRMGGIRGYWLEEAGEKTKSKPKFRQITLSLKKLIGLCYATDELLEDAGLLEQVIREGFRKEIDFMLTDAIINGSGAGQPLGILTGGGVVSVAKETGQRASTVVAENVLKMHSRLFASSRKNAIWLINQNIEPQLHQMSISVGTGGIPVYMPANGLSGKPYASLLGLPVVPIEQCQTLGTKGDIYLADFSNGYALATKGGLQSDFSIHLRFQYDESVFRFVLRCDGNPILASPVTPYKGGSGSTLSHFVTLDARS